MISHGKFHNSSVISARDSLDLLGQVAFQGAAHHQSSHDDHTCIDHLATNEAKLVSLVIEH